MTDLWLIVALCALFVAVVAGCTAYLLWWYAGKIDALRQVEAGRRQPMLNGDADPWPPERRGSNPPPTHMKPPPPANPPRAGLTEGRTRTQIKR